MISLYNLKMFARRFGIAAFAAVVIVFLKTAIPAQGPAKVNPRQSNPSGQQQNTDNPQKTNSRQAASKTDDVKKTTIDFGEPRIIYNFVIKGRPVDQIKIENDFSGRAILTFHRREGNEEITQEITLSTEILDKIGSALKALDFLNSNENYQYEKDYSHLGTTTITMIEKGKSRTAAFNWTQNAFAKQLADEYRRIALREIWVFDFNTARENQPLETPHLMETFDSMLAMNDIADPRQMIPFFKDCISDERIPLIARNRAASILKKIEKIKPAK
ncbi:MAG TPA: hypothetical protein VNK26_00770 [Pyrinomonadaceae bacterium]|nr:hypothetical protein [Pyrinomonadaceae bacterium]